MAIIKSKKINATGYTRGLMQFDHVLHEDGIWYTHYGQSYSFVNEKNERVDGLQNKSSVEGSIPDTELQALLPDVWKSLVFLYGWFDNEIKKQEGIK